MLGAFLVFTGIKMWSAAGEQPDLESNRALRWLCKQMKISAQLDRFEASATPA